MRLGSRLTPAIAKKMRLDLVVVASGARLGRINVPGIDKPHVVTAWDVLADKVPNIGDRVVVVGGNTTGCETALYVAGMGIPNPETFTFLMVHSAEERDAASRLLQTPGRDTMVIETIPRMVDNAGCTARWSPMKSLRLLGVTLLPATTLLEIKDDAVLVQTPSGKETLPAETVILAAGTVPVADLARDLEGSGISVITIGDAGIPGKITDAVQQGFEVALLL